MDLKTRYKPNVVFIAETRVSGARAENIISSLGFGNFFKLDPLGYADGLWILWDKAEIEMKLFGHTFQEIHAKMEASLDNLLEIEVDMVEVGDIMVDSLDYFEKTHKYHKYYGNVNN
ncbi:reverse transcriptase [Senna tora]|uniref:Reverse transcriptase n=1 Tax=Senna tora TaxID=362788 RepID=A0A834W8J7_9FABA|nr:reverse transcriptase [Senna tora]